VDNIRKSFSETFRILKNKGFIILGFVDKNSPIGKFYLGNQDKSIFYRDAKFFTTEEVLELLRQTGFVVSEIYQTVFGKLSEVKEVHPVEKGYGKGSFIVIKAVKETGLKVDIVAPTKTALSMTVAIDQFLLKQNKK
jgi:hypothetical protein